VAGRLTDGVFNCLPVDFRRQDERGPRRQSQEKLADCVSTHDCPPGGHRLGRSVGTRVGATGCACCSITVEMALLFMSCVPDGDRTDTANLSKAAMTPDNLMPLTRNTQTGVRFAISAPRKSDCKSASPGSTVASLEECLSNRESASALALLVAARASMQLSSRREGGENIFAPGAGSPSIERPYRVVRLARLEDSTDSRGWREESGDRPSRGLWSQPDLHL
jgi:hypothetical protein